MKGNRFNFFGLIAVIALLSSLSLSAAAEPQSAKIAVVDARIAIFSSKAAQNALKTFEESADFMSLNLQAKRTVIQHGECPAELLTNSLVSSSNTNTSPKVNNDDTALLAGKKIRNRASRTRTTGTQSSERP